MGMTCRRRRSGWARAAYLLLICGLTLPVIALTHPPRGASAAGSATINTDALNLRGGPGTGYRVITVMYQGESVTVLDGPLNGWYKVRYRSSTGWAFGDYLKLAGGSTTPPATGTGTATVNTDALNLRGGPGTGYAVLRVMYQGQAVAIVSGPSNGWYQVTYQGVTGWAYATYLAVGGSPTTPSAATTATVDVDLLNLRSGPGTGNSILGQMLYGETVKILGSSGDWYRVSYFGTTGYAYGSYLRFGADSASVWVPVHQQEHSLSCEYASLQIATAGLGHAVAEDRFIPVVGQAANPHDGFRGNIDGTYIFGTDDYGVYPEPLARALPVFGFKGEVFYGGVDKLKAHLRAGHPVVVWIDLGFHTSFKMTIGGQSVTMAPRSHVVVAYGYFSGGVLISDPDSSNPKRVIPWSDFNVMWQSMDQMALAVSR